MSLPTPSPARRADLDALRVGAILLLLAYHTGMVFTPWPFHIKNAQLLPALELPMQVMHALRMPLLMVIAGMGTALAMRRRTPGAFARERLLRLGLPLLVGMLVIVPPQIWIERGLVGHCAPLFLDAVPGSGWQGRFLDFWPTVLQGRPYPAGNLSWHHLWFMAYLLLFCLAFLPLLAWLRTERGRALLDRCTAWLARGPRVLLLCLPLILVRILLRRYPETHALLDDPRTLAYYGLLFLYGHLLASSEALLERVTSLRHLGLGLGLLLLALLLPPGEFPFLLEYAATHACVWLLLLAALGYARRHWVRRGPWLAHAQEIALPFYILHQTVIILVAYALLEAPLGPWTKLAAVLLLSFAFTWAGCEVVRRLPFLRPLFGLRLRKRDKPAVAYPASHEA